MKIMDELRSLMDNPRLMASRHSDFQVEHFILGGPGPHPEYPLPDSKVQQALLELWTRYNALLQFADEDVKANATIKRAEAQRIRAARRIEQIDGDVAERLDCEADIEESESTILIQKVKRDVTAYQITEKMHEIGVLKKLIARFAPQCLFASADESAPLHWVLCQAMTQLKPGAKPFQLPFQRPLSIEEMNRLIAAAGQPFCVVPDGDGYAVERIALQGSLEEGGDHAQDSSR